MAKKAKAKAKRRAIRPIWVVRDDIYTDPVTYSTFVGDPPTGKPGGGGRWQQSQSDRRGGVYWCDADYESGTPEDCHLKPGGGPLQMKLVRA